MSEANKTSADWTLSNGEDLAYSKNLAGNLGFTPEMYAWTVNQFLERFPDGNSSGVFGHEDVGAINYFRNFNPMTAAQQMTEAGLDIGDSEKWQAYRTNLEDNYGRDFSFLEAQAPVTGDPAATPAGDMLAYQGPSESPQPMQQPDYGQAQQRPAYDFSPQQQSQPMSIKQAQVNNFHNAAHSDWQGKQQEMQNGLLDMGQYRQKMGLLG